MEFHFLPRPGEPQDWEIEVLDKDTLEPVEGARVGCPITRWFHPGSAFNPWSGLTGGIGKSLITGIPPGNWGVTAAAEGYNPTLIPLESSSSKGNKGLPQTMTILLGPISTPSAVDDWALYR